MSIDNNAHKIVRLLQQKGFDAFFVGGYVRNLLTKRQSGNFDIATIAEPDEVERILKKAGLPTKTVGKKYGTVLVPLKIPIEITTFRSEGWYSDKRHPDKVEFIKDFREDAKRRDFTINALYFDPLTKELFDPTRGIKDLRLKILRFVGDPKMRIDEDHLRMIRAVRIATQLGFKIEKNSFAAIKTRAKYINSVSGERVKAELDKLLLSNNRALGLKLLDQSGLAQFIIPELAESKKLYHKSKRYHLEGSTYDHTILALQKLRTNDLNLIYATLFHDLGKPFTAKPKLKQEGWVVSTKGHETVSAEIFSRFAKKYRFKRQDEKLIKWAILNHMVIFHFPEMREEKRISHALHKNVDFLIKLSKVDDDATVRKLGIKDPHHGAWRIAQRLEQKIASLSDKIIKLASGRKILSYSKLRGPEVGRAIEAVKVQIVLGKIKNETDLKNLLQRNGQKHLTS